MTDRRGLLSQLSQLTDPVDRVGEPAPTDGRTDGRTENPLTAENQLTAVDARRRYDGLALVGDLITGPPLESERHPVIRTGDRDPIPHEVRSAVWFRDRGRCEFCQDFAGEGWELDHIIPWSAGGKDETTNLRVLCGEHNQQRSNYASHEDARPRMPATWWCERCYGVDREPWDYADSGYVACPIHKRSKREACPVQRNYDWGREREDWKPWHQRRDVMEPTRVAYCAHCRMPGVTDVTL